MNDVCLKKSLCCDVVQFAICRSKKQDSDLKAGNVKMLCEVLVEAATHLHNGVSDSLLSQNEHGDIQLQLKDFIYHLSDMHCWLEEF